MAAGFFKRAFSTLFDFVLIFALIYLTYLAVGRTVIQNQIPYFDELYEAFQEINDVYTKDNDRIRLEYDAQMTLADGNKELETLALTRYTEQMALLDAQNLVDIEPYNQPLTRFFLFSIYYFAVGFLIVMGIYTVAMKGKTIGRRLLKIELKGSSNPLMMFMHDIILKYFLLVLVIMVSLYGGLMFLLFAVLFDLTLITFTRTKRTLRDSLLKMSVETQGKFY